MAAARWSIFRTRLQMRKWLTPEVGRFVGVGILNTLTGLLTIYAAKWFLHAGDVAANVIGYAVGICISFKLNGQWTFGYNGAQWPALIKFLAVTLVAYATNLLTVMGSIHYLDLNGYFAQALGIAPYAITSYLASKHFVFAQKTNEY